MAHARRRWTQTLFILLAGAAVALPSTASAQWRPNPTAVGTPSKAQIEEAKARFKQGIRLYQEEGQLEAALIELQRAYDLAPNYRILYNIGQVARSLPDYVASLGAFERYLLDGGKEIPAPRWAEVEKEIADLRDRVATITLSTNMEGATVSLDDLPIGKTPLPGPLLVNPGRRRITVAKDGLVASKIVTVAGRDSVKLDVPLEQQARTEPTAPTRGSGAGREEHPSGSATPPTPTPVKAATPSPTAPAKSSYTWVGWTATGVLAVGTGITGALALSASSDVKNARYAGSEIPPDVADAQSRTETLAIVADVFAGATAVALGVTLAFTLMRSGGDKPPAARTTAGREGAPTLRLGIGPGAIQLGGTF